MMYFIFVFSQVLKRVWVWFVIFNTNFKIDNQKVIFSTIAIIAKINDFMLSFVI